MARVGGRATVSQHAVVIAGAGPTGLMLAGELALAGIDVVIVEPRSDQELDGSRAGGLHSRTIEVLDQRGVADRFLAEGTAMQVQSYAAIPLDISDFPTRHNYGLALWQNHFERILGGWVAELGVPIAREREVTGFTQDDAGVVVELSDGGTLGAQYLVGCDGGRSRVRRAAGIEFCGWDPTKSTLVAEVEMTAEPPPGLRRDHAGVHGLHRMEDGRTIRAVVTEQQPRPSNESGRESREPGAPTLTELQAALVAVWGTDFGVHSPTWISRFTDMTRQAACYRSGRVLLAGDAAHVHYPVGGQGLNTGVQDAVNLGWKLAQVVKGTSGEDLLDTYHAERHPVGARVLQNTMAQTVLTRSDARLDALRDAMTELLSMDEPRRRFAAMISGLDVHYDMGEGDMGEGDMGEGDMGEGDMGEGDMGEGHPLLGRRVPDLDVQTADGPTRVFTLLHEARPVLLNLGEPGGFDIAPWADRVRLVQASYEGTWQLPVLGEVAAPAAVLIRPDGHSAWVGDLAEPALPRALTAWFGPPAPASRAPDAARSCSPRRDRS